MTFPCKLGWRTDRLLGIEMDVGPRVIVRSDLMSVRSNGPCCAPMLLNPAKGPVSPE